MASALLPACAAPAGRVEPASPGPSQSGSHPIEVYRPGATLPDGSTTLGELTAGDDPVRLQCGRDAVVAAAKSAARAVGGDAIYLVREQGPDDRSLCWRVTARILRYGSHAAGRPLGRDPAHRVDTVAAMEPTPAWGRPVPGPAEVVKVLSADRNPSGAASPFERSADAIFRVTGADGNGTAFFISRDGLALTNHHVVAGPAPIRGVLRDGSEVPVKVLRSDSVADVALIQARCPRPCSTLDVGMGSPEIGRDVHVIGSPLSWDFTLTRGIVSAVRRGRGATLVQTDAAINPGNSGGPILDAESREVIAIVAWKVMRERAEGLGFGVVAVDALRTLGVEIAMDTAAVAAKDGANVSRR